MEFQLFLIVVVIVLLVIVFSARQGFRGGRTRGEPRRQCPGCMTSLPAHARFCARCGRKQG